MADHMTAEQLLPCPFCGERLFIKEATNHDGSDCWEWAGHPMNGCIMRHYAMRMTSLESVALWNRRDAVAARLSGMAAVPAPTQSDDGYYIACFKGGPRGYVVWWGPNDRGYTNDLGAAGVYANPVAGYHDRDDDNVPVPVAFARRLAARRMVDTGDSGNECMWSAATLRAALAQESAAPEPPHV